jgi:DNA (cytosine-5)-methyltransferase 1
MGGERSSLILEAIRLIKECRPDFFIWENVKGTFSSNNREDFAGILQAFANIGGYRLEWQLLNTKWFLPQNRERVYLVGYTPRKSRGQIFPIGESIKRDVIEKESSACITTSYHKGVNFDNQLIAAQRGRAYRGQPQQLEFREDGNSNTLSTVQKDNYVVKPIVNSIRRLTPIECERLQGFPDNWTYQGVDGPISDTQRYKMCGNAVTVDVVEAVGKKIIKL